MELTHLAGMKFGTKMDIKNFYKFRIQEELELYTRSAILAGSWTILPSSSYGLTKVPFIKLKYLEQQYGPYKCNGMLVTRCTDSIEMI